ncbi:MAG: MaoC family dehydratase [Acidimicrobiia bacterium]|nr:MaoC family dehydratase [Acidimicrobiia bacterium]
MKVAVGEAIPPFRMERVTPERMRTVAAIFRDPTPIHWDRDVTRALGFDGRLLNQTPLNMAYVINMLMAWAGPTCVRRIRAAFPQPVLEGDSVTAHGEVAAVSVHDGGTLAVCDVWLERQDGVRNLVGRAWVALPADTD